MGDCIKTNNERHTYFLTKLHGFQASAEHYLTGKREHILKGYEIQKFQNLENWVNQLIVPYPWLSLPIKNQKFTKLVSAPAWVVQVTSYFSNHSWHQLLLFGKYSEAKNCMWEVYWKVSSSSTFEWGRITIRQKNLICGTFIIKALYHFSDKGVKIIMVAW